MKAQRILLTCSLLMASSGSARAELWHPLDTVPKPNVVVGVDHSVTMAITPDCSRCHRDGLGGNPSRLDEMKSELGLVMPMFQNYFQYSAFTYSACGYARITGRSPIPVSNNLNQALTDSINVINGAGHCNSSETSWPLAATGGSSPCLTPTAGCFGDPAAVQDIFNTGIDGLNIPMPVMTSTTCDLTGLPYDLTSSLMLKLAGGAFTWPRWGGANTPPTPTQVTDDLCTPLQSVLSSVQTEINTCSSRPVGIWDMSFLAGALSAWCNPGNISTSICNNTPASAPFAGLRDTCTCDMTQPDCDLGAAGFFSECGNPLSWKARQQVAVCEAYSTDPGRFGRMFLNQPDNKVVAGGCRENVGLFMTDGYMGGTFGTYLEAAGAQPAYGSTSVVGLTNMFVFRISNVFSGQANNMQQAVSNDPMMVAFDATNVQQMTGAFAQVLSRIFKGVYVGARFGMDDIQSQAFMHVVSVPGANGAPPVNDRYLGFPTRISAHNVDAATGALSPNAVWETDWTSKATTSPGCYTQLNTGGGDVPLLGPGGTFGNGVARTQTVNSGSIDRDGNGTLDVTPGTAQIRFGRMHGFASSKPVVVGWPSEAAPNGDYTNWAAHRAAIRTRRQGVYFSDGGYVLGIHGGDFVAGTNTYGTTTRSYRYNLAVADAGKEILRYKPSWINDPEVTYNYTLNNWVTQPMITGDLVAQEVWINTGTPRWATLLVGNQGQYGRGYFAVDITNPCNPVRYREWVLPSTAKASAAPVVAYVKRAAGGFSPVVVTVGGVGGPPALYVYNLETGAGLVPTLAATIPLPAGASYIAAPACLSSKGGQAIDVCYALREDGFLARVMIGVNGAPIGAAVDATPIDGGGNRLSMASGEIFTTTPLVYFDSRGRVNVVYGGGDYRNLTTSSGQNYLYRAIDASNRQATATTPTLDQVCTPSGGSTLGRIPFGPGERLISAPSIANGVVAAATYATASSGCASGGGFVYAMNSESCTDATSPALRPVANTAGSGIPTTPTLHRQSGELLIGGSDKPRGVMVAGVGVTSTKGLRPMVRRLYFRYDQSLR
ncbi:MAG: hypothetical protein IPG45_21175 [Deltaproteobacteria bacterium]|nr:hypothetical protein [Deltaproteobacteria bacterium]